MDKKKEYKEKAKILALQNGFDQVSYYGEWKGYLVYTASRKEDKECCIGYPQFILVKDDAAHLAPYTQVHSYNFLTILSIISVFTNRLSTRNTFTPYLRLISLDITFQSPKRPICGS